MYRWPRCRKLISIHSTLLQGEQRTCKKRARALRNVNVQRGMFQANSRQ